MTDYDAMTQDLEWEEPKSDEEWQAARDRGQAVELDAARDLAPLCYFDRSTKADDRRQWAQDVMDLAIKMIPPSQRPPSDALYLMPDDLSGDWFEEFEQAKQSTVVTLRPDWFEDLNSWVISNELVVFTLTRSDADALEFLDGIDPAACNIALDAQVWQMAASAMGMCGFFWWASPDGLVGFDLELRWPYMSEHDDSIYQPTEGTVAG